MDEVNVDGDDDDGCCDGDDDGQRKLTFLSSDLFSKYVCMYAAVHN